MRFWLARSLFVLTMLIAACAAQHTASAAPSRLPACGPLLAHFSTGALPHQAFTLPTDRANHWHPIATDGPHILLSWEYSREPVFGGPVRLSIVHLPSTRLVPVPRSAYPRRTFLGGWQLDWPWIAGIAYTTPLPAIPANWQLWAGNIVTGQHVILDGYRAHKHPVPEFYPHFALDAGRIVWEYSTEGKPGTDGSSPQRIALVDLATRHQTFLTAPTTDAVYGPITLSGSRIIWQRAGAYGKVSAADLWFYDLRSHTLSQLSHNTTASGSSLYPRLSGRYLLFEQGTYGSDGGTAYLVDLTASTGAPGREWWRAYRFRELGTDGLTNTQMGTGLVSWANWNLLDMTRSRKWPTWYWRVDAIEGRTVLVDHLDPNNAHETYVAWQVPVACTPAGFR